MYVDEQGDTTTDTQSSDDGLTVDIDGESYEVEENYDFDQDGENDTAVVQTEDGYIAFADTDGDGTADVAVEMDGDGTVVAGAEYDESTGEWTEENPDNLPTPSGGKADGSDPGSNGRERDTADDSSGSGNSDSGSDSGTESGTGSERTGSGGEDITVETPDGEFGAGQAEYDTDGDGTNDTAVVTDEKGTTYAFTDADGDGTADTAVVIEADGDVTVAENTGGDEWQVLEQGQLNEDGTYDSGSSGSDSVWAESR